MVEEARRNGARLIVIDPYRTRTAALADWHIAIRPGTDVALALGMMHVILQRGPGRPRLYCGDDARLCAACGAGARIYAGARGGVDGHDGGGD